MPVRGAHPGIGGGLLRLAHIDQPIGGGEFVRDQNIFLRLDDLKRIRQISRARNARHVAFHFRVVLPAVRFVLLLFGEPRWRIWNLAAFHDPLTRGNRADRAELIKRPGCGTVILNIPVRRAHRLPKPVQIRLAVGHTRDSRAGRLAGTRQRGHQECGARGRRNYASFTHNAHQLYNHPSSFSRKYES